MEKKNIYSIRKSKFGAVSAKIAAVTFLALAGGSVAVATEAHAADENATATEEKEYKVSDNQVKDAEKKVQDKKEEVRKAEESANEALAKLNKQKDAVKAKEDAVKNAEDEVAKNNEKVEEAKKATPEKIKEASDAVANKQKEITNKEADKAAADKDVTDKEAVKNNADKNVVDKEKEVETAKKQEEAAKNIQDKATTDLGEAGKELVKIQDDVEKITTLLNEKNKEKTEKENALKAAKDESTKAAQSIKKIDADITTKTTEKNNKEKEVSDTKADLEKNKTELEKNQKDIDTVNKTIKNIEAELAKQQSDNGKYNTSEKTDADADNVMGGIEGEFLTPDKEAILKRINEIRKEAFDEGLVKEYVPIKWSNALEKATLARAVESSITINHRRLSKNTNIWSAFDDASDVNVSGENLAWNFSGIIDGINQFYEEKEDYLKEIKGLPHDVTGHYKSMINPSNTYTALSGFRNRNAAFPVTVAEAFGTGISNYNADGTITTSPANESLVGTYGKKVQLTQVDKTSIVEASLVEKEKTVETGKKTNPLITGKFKLGNYTYPLEIRSGLSWTSDNSAVASDDGHGNIVGNKAGVANLTAKVGNNTFTVKVTVVDLQGEKDSLNNLTTRQATLNNEKATLEKKVTDSTKELDQLNNEISSLNTSKNELSKVFAKVNSLQDEVDTLNKEITQSDSTLSALKTRLKTIEDNNKEKVAALTKATEDYNNAKANTKKAQDELVQLRSKAKQAQDELDTAKANAKKEADDLEKLNNELKSLSSNLANLQNLANQRTALEKALADSNNKLSAARLELKNEQDKVAPLQKDYDELNANVAKLKSELKALEDEYNRLLALYTKERMPKSLVMDPKEELPAVVVDEKVAVEDLDYKVIEQEDPTLPVGERKLKVAGQKGQKQIKTTKFIVNGEVLDTKVDETVVKEVVDEVVLVGTKKETTPPAPGETPREVPGGEDKIPGETPKGGSNSQTTITKGGKALPKTTSTTNTSAALGLVSLVVAAVESRRKEK